MTDSSLIDSSVLLLFASDGRKIAGSPGADARLGRPITSLTELEALIGSSVPADDEAGDADADDERAGRVATFKRLSSPDGELVLVTVRPRATDDLAARLHAMRKVLAHELRTPLTTIYVGAQLLSNPNTPASLVQDAAETIRSEADRLHRVVEDVVALSRVAPVPEDELEPVLLQRALPEAQRHRHRSIDARVDWQLPADLPAVVGHQPRLEHAFADLVDNALRFASPGDSVRVSGRVRDSEIEVHIDDEGVGLVAREKDDPFGLFAVGPRAGASASGANLGLFVAARLIESMGGRVWADDASTRGRVRFALPRADVAMPGS